MWKLKSSLTPSDSGRRNPWGFAQHFRSREHPRSAVSGAGSAGVHITSTAAALQSNELLKKHLEVTQV